MDGNINIFGGKDYVTASVFFLQFQVQLLDISL